MIAGVSSQMLGSWVEFVVCAQKQFIMASFVTKKPKLRIISLADEWEEMQLRGRPMQPANQEFEENRPTRGDWECDQISLKCFPGGLSR